MSQNALNSSYLPGKTHTVPARSGVAVPLSPDQTIRVINTHGTQVVDTWAFIVPSASDDDAVLNLNHHMSMSHTRARNNRFSPLVDDTLYTNHRVPILKLVEDTSPGVHDTAIAACDVYRYRELMGKEMDGDGYWHESCAENLARALKRDVGVDVTGPGRFGGWGNGPDPLNLWMNIPIHVKSVAEPEPEPGIERRQAAVQPGLVDGAKGKVHAHAVPAHISPSAGADLSFEKPVSKAGNFVRLKNVSGQEVVVVMSACPQDLLDINCGTPTSVEFVVEEAKAEGR